MLQFFLVASVTKHLTSKAPMAAIRIFLKFWLTTLTIAGLTIWTVDINNLKVHTSFSNILMPVINIALYSLVEWISYFELKDKLDMVRIFGNDIAKVSQTIMDLLFQARSPCFLIVTILTHMMRRKMYQCLVEAFRKLNGLNLDLQLPLFVSFLQLGIAGVNISFFIAFTAGWMGLDERFHLQLRLISDYLRSSLINLYRFVVLLDLLFILACVNLFFKTITVGLSSMGPHWSLTKLRPSRRDSSINIRVFKKRLQNFKRAAVDWKKQTPKIQYLN